MTRIQLNTYVNVVAYANIWLQNKQNTETSATTVSFNGLIC